MPRKSLKSKAQKRPSKSIKTTPQTSRRKKKQIPEIVPAESEGSYIDIYEKNPEIEKKIKTLWLIIIPIAILLVIFWFWLLRQNLAANNENGSLTDLRDEISRTMNEIQNNINLNRGLISSTTEGIQNIDEVKDQVIEQLQKNLDPQTWPSHDSEIMAISVKYPPEWSQNEQKESITISAPSMHNSSSSETSTDKTYSRVSINRENVSAKTKIEDWLKKNAPSKAEYTISTSTNIILIDGKKTITYQQIKLNPEDINQIIFLQNEKFIYKIQIDVLGRKTLDESYIKGIINNIKFLP